MHNCAPPKDQSQKAPVVEAKMLVQDESLNFSIFVQFAKVMQW
jgi:hypothetical protein